MSGRKQRKQSLELALFSCQRGSVVVSFSRLLLTLNGLRYGRRLALCHATLRKRSVARQSERARTGLTAHFQLEKVGQYFQVYLLLSFLTFRSRNHPCLFSVYYYFFDIFPP